MAQPDVERPPAVTNHTANDTTADAPTEPKAFPDVQAATKDEETTELKIALNDVKKMPPTSLYDLVESLWAAKRPFADLLLNWGDTADKFQLLRAAASRIKEGDETSKKIATDVSIQIVTKSPNVIAHQWSGGHPTVLHIAALAESSDLVNKIFDSAEGVKDFDAVLEVKNSQCRGKTPLRVAVEADLVCLVRRILQHNNRRISDPKLLAWVLIEGSSEMIQALIKLRPGDMTENVVQHALEQKDVALITTLQDLKECHHLFEHRGFLHKLVEGGDVTIIHTLLDKLPKLALELDDKNKPALSYNDKNESAIKARIRDKIVPLIIRQIALVDRSRYGCLFADDLQMPNRPEPRVSEVVRALIADPSDNRQEISLSLGGFGSWASGAQSFLNLIRSSKSAKQPDDKPLNTLLQVGFEHTLIYVDIPVPDLPAPRAGAKPTLTRSEVWEILSWLKNSKEVTGIYELSVRDSCYLPHNENVIRACLTAFDIEVLDWRRLDLSLRVLRDSKDALACRNLKQLRLYAGGWPALAFWTSDEGLSFLDCLPKLTQVDIFILKEFVGGNLSEVYRKDAEARFDTFKGDHPKTELKVTPRTMSWSNLNPAQEKPKPTPDATAVEVTRLGPFLEAYESLHRDFAQPKWRSATLRNDLDETRRHTPYIKVAVVDNGVDPGSIDCHGVSGASFVPSETGESNWWYIKHAHGTKMARIITELNPHCHLLVAKVCEDRADFTPSRLVKALNWAVAAGADVVSLSLTLNNDSNDLQIAVNNAVGRGVVVVASVHGEGANTKGPGFPADYKNVLAIGSADGRGAPSSGPVDEHANYLFQGEKIVARTGFLGGLEDASDTSGPSVATAIAAGVASLVLACDRFALHHRAEAESTWTQHEKLKGDVVAKIFKRMTDKNYVRPWIFFAEDKSKPAWGEGDSVLKWIAGEFDSVLGAPSV